MSRWFGEYEAPVLGAIVDTQRIVFDFTCEEADYNVVLQPAVQSPLWHGPWTCRTNNTQGRAQAKLYQAAGGGNGIVLVGLRQEEGDWFWVTESS